MFYIVAVVSIIAVIIFLYFVWGCIMPKKEGFEAGDNLQSVVNYIEKQLIVSKMIVMWNGPANGIPSGWALCNGQNGTPDLRDKFIVCAGSQMPQNNKGGSNSHSIRLSTANLPSHSHSLCDDYQVVDAKFINDSKIAPGSKISLGGDRYLGSGNSDGNNSIFCRDKNTSTVGTNAPINIDNRPEYYALAFIMRL